VRARTGREISLSCSPAPSAAEQLNEAEILLRRTPLRSAPWWGGHPRAAAHPSRGSAYLAPRWLFASESGEWHESWREGGVLTELRGSYLALWRKVEGRWLLDAEVFVPLSCAGSSYCNPRR
jgi:hypothetical protein